MIVFFFFFLIWKDTFLVEGQPLTCVLSGISQKKVINSRSSQLDLLWQWLFSNIEIFSLLVTASNYILTVGKSGSSEGEMQKGLLYKKWPTGSTPRLLLLNHVCNCLPCLGGNRNEIKIRDRLVWTGSKKSWGRPTSTSPLPKQVAGFLFAHFYKVTSWPIGLVSQSLSFPVLQRGRGVERNR